MSWLFLWLAGDSVWRRCASAATGARHVVQVHWRIGACRRTADLDRGAGVDGDVDIRAPVRRGNSTDLPALRLPTRAMAQALCMKSIRTLHELCANNNHSHLLVKQCDESLYRNRSEMKKRVRGFKAGVAPTLLRRAGSWRIRAACPSSDTQFKRTTGQST